STRWRCWMLRAIRPGSGLTSRLNGDERMKTIVISGCSSGFGRVTAFYLAERGWRVLATVRQAAQRSELLAEAENKGLGDRLLPILSDITRPDDVEKLARAVMANGPALDALVN